MSSGSGNVSYVTNIGGATNSSAVPGIVIPISSMAGLVSLFFGNGATGANGFNNFWSGSSPTSTTPYQVPAAKTLVVLGYYMQVDAVANRWMFGYGTAAAVAENTGTAPTGAVYYAPSSTTYLLNTGGVTTAYAPLSISFPAQSYPFMKTESSATYRACAFGVLL